MNKLRVIDLLNKIANGEEVPNFWWNGCIHEVQKEYGTNKYSIFDTYCKKYKKIELEDLNDEIKFLEEEKKIPKKICTNRIINTNDILEFEMIQNKINAEYTYAINSIIDYLKSKGDE